MGVFLLMLMMGTGTGPSGAVSDPAVLADRLALIREGSPFLELDDQSIGIYVAGWRVKELPAEIHQVSIGESGSVTAVSEVVPLVPPRRVVLDSAELAGAAQDPVGNVSSLDQIIGVDEMPTAFLVRFEDGTVWFVNFEQWAGFSGVWAKARLRIGVLLDETKHLLEVGSLRTRFLEMPADMAQELYWVLAPGMKTLQ